MGVPVVANGDIRSEGDVERVRRETGVDGKLSKNEGSGQHLFFAYIALLSASALYSGTSL